MRNPLKRKPQVADLYSGNAGLKRIKRRRLNKFVIVIAAAAAVLLAIIITVSWYEWALRPLDAGDSNHVRVTIAPGTEPAKIGQQLKTAHLIRSSYAFQVYIRLSGQENRLQAGSYAFAANESTRTIVADLASGKTDQFAITIVPGQTLKDIKTSLENHGYTSGEIDAAYDAAYTDGLTMLRPAGASLEGFLYPDTYNVLSDETLQTVFSRVFDHFNDVATQNNLAAGFAAHGLSVYQGITLASIVQREVSTPDDQRKVASVFYNRLDADMTLGSEVTFRYGADLLGVAPTTTLNSPYNLYINKGLTPTPISSPGLSALQAVANPAQTDYLYFLTGDDGVTYFAQTDAQHEANIKAHCQKSCG